MFSFSVFIIQSIVEGLVNFRFGRCTVLQPDSVRGESGRAIVSLQELGLRAGVGLAFVDNGGRGQEVEVILFDIPGRSPILSSVIH